MFVCVGGEGGDIAGGMHLLLVIGFFVHMVVLVYVYVCVKRGICNAYGKRALKPTKFTQNK